VAAAGGLAGSLPLALYGASGPADALLSLAAATVGAGLFGVTYRYAVRRDAANVQLKVQTQRVV
jgi:hypothetical protein